MTIGAPDLAIGTLSKVLSLSPAEQAFHFRTQEGKLGRMAGVDFLPELGDVVIINNNGWVRTDPHLWIAGNSVAVVRQILGAERVLIEGALGLTTTSNRLGLELADGNTVEYSDAEGIARVISETPVRSRRFGDDDSLNAQDYRVQVKDGPGLTFSDFGGYADVVSRARELIDIQFRRRKNLDKIGARPLRGVMFSGPPGTGKTHLARIIAHEAEADFYLISGPSIVSKWLGESED